MKKKQFGFEAIGYATTDVRKRVVEQYIYAALTAMQMHMAEMKMGGLNWRWLQPDEIPGEVKAKRKTKAKK